MKIFNKTRCKTTSFIIGMVFLSAFFIYFVPANGAILYKSYVVRYDRGWDILCEPYIVQKNDWVYKIFRQKGEISSQDFQEFTNIVKRLNPQIRDVNRIRPNQSILIPIKKIEPNAFPNQSKGLVTIPFVTISKMTELLNAHAVPYYVQKGDYISRLITERFGGYGTKTYLEGIELFKAINPDIRNLNLIYIGQKINLPNPAMRNEPWYRSLFDGFGKIKKELDEKPAIQPEEEPDVKVAVIQRPVKSPTDPLSRTAAILEAKLLKKGTYFFPRAGQEDFKLDLSRFPVIEMKDGSRIIFADKTKSSKPDLNFLNSYWKNSTIVEIDKHTTVDELVASIFKDKPKSLVGNTISLKDDGLEITVKAQWIKSNPSKTGDSRRYICITVIENDQQQTSDAIVRYLDQHGILIREVVKRTDASSNEKEKTQETASPFMLSDVTTIAPTDQKTFVFDLLDALGLTYHKNVSITFPYAGLQVEALSNFVSTGKGKDFLIDFGELYGDAVQEIKKTGIDAIQLKDEDGFDQIIAKILGALGKPYVANPKFLAAKRPDAFNTELKINGYLLNNTDTADILISGAPLHNRVLQFLNETGITVILTGLFDVK
jgi:hypothetical protein